MRRLGLALGGLLLAVVLLIVAAAQVPARFVAPFIDEQQVRLSGFSGSLRSGQAARALVQTPVGFVHLGRLQWELNLASLLSLTPSLRVESRWGRQRIESRIKLGAGGRLSLRDLDASIDAALLQQVFPADLAGRINLLFDELTVEGEELLQARGRLVWQDAGWHNGSGVQPLGSYAVVLSSPAERSVEAQVDTLAGPVEATGSASLVEGRYDLTLDVTLPSSGVDLDLRRALDLIAMPSETGYRLRLDGDLTRR